MKPFVIPNGLAALSGRLTDPQDREAYARLVSYIGSLPPDDEFRQLAEWFGLLSVVGQRVPEALAHFLAELRTQAASVADYCGQVDTRLANLPREIAAGVDAAAIAKDMSESFRQQIVASGLQDTAALLKAASMTMKNLSTEIAAGLKPAVHEYQGIALAISKETSKLIDAACRLQERNARLLNQQQAVRWLWQVAAGVALFLLGGAYGMFLEKRNTSDVLSNMAIQVERIQRALAPHETATTWAPPDSSH